MDIDWFSIKDSAGSQECVNDLDNIVEVKLKSDFSRIKLSESINNIIDNIKKKNKLKIILYLLFLWYLVLYNNTF